MSKVSNLNLYSSDNLSEKALHVVGVDAKLSMTSPNEMEFSAPFFSIKGQTTSAHDISDLGLYLKTLSDLQGSDSTTQSAAIATNTTNIASLTATETANHSAQATLLGVETALRASSDTTLQTNITAEETARINADATLTASVSTEASARTAADVVLQTAIDVEKDRITAILAGSTISTDSLQEIVNLYTSADTSILASISAIQTQLTALQAEVDSLTA